MVDGLIRQQMDALEAASDEARLKLREWELPECLQALDTGSSAALPDGLRAELEQLENNGGVRHLQELQKQVQVFS
jgi:programmed cell death 6-interacting protein